MCYYYVCDLSSHASRRRIPWPDARPPPPLRLSFDSARTNGNLPIQRFLVVRHGLLLMLLLLLLLLLLVVVSSSPLLVRLLRPCCLVESMLAAACTIWLESRRPVAVAGRGGGDKGLGRE